MFYRLVLSMIFILMTVLPLPAQAVSAAPKAGGEQPVLKLSMKRAVEIALSPEGNAKIALAAESLRQAEARAAQSRAALLPNVEASVTQQNLTRNLEAFGIRLDIPIPGYRAPTFVGPFNVFDARATLTQSLFDLSALRRFQAARAGITHARAENESAQDQVRDLVARSYLTALRADASLETARANLTLAEALLKLASDQKSTGTATGIEVARARVQHAHESQQLLVTENERRAEHLRLLKAIGLDLEVILELTDPLVLQPVQPASLEQALQIALASRSDWKAQREREESLRLLQSAARVERIPSISAFADYGTIGSSIHNAIPTRSYGVMVRLPVFDGGRQDARRSESESQYRQEGNRTAELRQEIELAVRLAIDALKSAEAQIKTAEEGLVLAEGELAQARRRYQAGVTTNLEVIDAQTRLQRARGNRISALFNHNLARVQLAAATGTIRKITQ